MSKYSDADKALKAELDKLIAGIDTGKSSFATVMAYGKEPLKKLEDISDRLVDIQNDLAIHVTQLSEVSGQATTFISGVDNINDGVKAINSYFDKLVEELEQLAVGRLRAREEISKYYYAGEEWVERHNKSCGSDKSSQFADKFNGRLGVLESQRLNSTSLAQKLRDCLVLIEECQKNLSDGNSCAISQVFKEISAKKTKHLKIRDQAHSTPKTGKPLRVKGIPKIE